MLAETPAGDVIADVLQGVRLNGSVFMDGRFAAPFGVISPSRWNEGTPQARLHHVSVFHFIAEGACTLAMPGGTETALSAGDMILLPFTPEHRFWQGDHDGFVDAMELISPGTIPGVMLCQKSGSGVETRLICGFLESAELMATPLFRSLPPLIVQRASDGQVAGPIATAAATLIRELEGAATPALQLILGRLMELLFVEMLRGHAAALPDDAKGLLAASRDPLVSRALTALHREPARKWTVDGLADTVGTSRSVLGERFTGLLEMPPMEYLTGWRMQLASNRLRGSREPLAGIAADVGYDSEAAFSRAFRRVVGISPGAWRQAA